MNWYYVHGGKQMGPVDELQLADLHRDAKTDSRVTDLESQQQALSAFQRLYAEVHALEKNRRPWLRLWSRPQRVSGIYLWGPVGRGKSFLMDEFFHLVPFAKKQRAHFHRFMQSIHHGLRELQGAADPLKLIAARMARETQLLCLDEFHVTDIGDAMLMRGLLEGVKRRLGGRTPELVTSDEFPAYPEALLAVFGETVVPPRTGKPGRPAGPRVVPAAGLAYTTVHKTRQRGRVVKVESRVVFGSAGSVASTSYLERQHGTDRHRNARKARKTYRFSRDWEAHEAASTFQFDCG